VSFIVNLAVVGTFAHFFYADACGDAGLACVPRHLGGLSTSAVQEASWSFLASAKSLPLSSSFLGIQLHGPLDPAANGSGSVRGQTCITATAAAAAAAVGGHASSDPGGGSWCDEIGLDQAGDALSAAIGPLGVTVWAVGLLAAGQASTMSTTFAGQGECKESS
jgi:hypothetical protein